MPPEKHANTIFTVFLLFLTILLIIAKNSEPDLKDIKDIDKTLEEKRVRVVGEVSRFAQRDNVAFIDIRDKTGLIKGVVFNKVNLREKNFVEVSGKVEIYNGELEIIASKIMVVAR